MSVRGDHRRHGPGRAPVEDQRVDRTLDSVLVVEPHALVAAGLQLALAGRGWDVTTSSTQSAVELMELAEAVRPRCALLSVRLGGATGSGIELIEPLASTGTRVLLLTSERRRSVLGRFLEAGAIGWVGRDAALDEVHSMLGRVVEGRSVLGTTIRVSLLDELRREREREARARAAFGELTQREALVLAAMTDGLTAEEIAREHFVAVCTIRSQIRGVLQKLDVRSQLAAVAIAAAHRELLPHRGDAEPDRRGAPPRDTADTADVRVGIA